MLDNTTTSATTTMVGEVVEKEADAMLQLYLPDDQLKQVLIFHITWLGLREMEEKRKASRCNLKMNLFQAYNLHFCNT